MFACGHQVGPTAEILGQIAVPIRPAWHTSSRASALLLTGGGLRLAPRAQFVERQIEDHALRRRVAVKNELVRAAEDAFHRLQIDAFAGDVLRLVVFLIDLEETRALAPGLSDRLLLVAF